MKQKLLFLLTAMLLLTTGNAWGDATHLITMTGQLGPSDNSAAWWTYYSKTATIKKGETYTYTFTNYDLQTFNDETASWILEIRDQSTAYCFDARGNSDKTGDNAGWKWDNGTDALTYNYTGQAWSELYGSASDFKTAYNGVEVTLTITRSADGGTVTVTRSATLNDSKDFSGTWTCSGFTAADNMTIDLVALYAHQNITKVVYTNASGVATTYELKNVDLSEFTGDFCSYDAGVVTFSVTGSSAVQKWCTLDLSSYYSGVPGQITDVNMTLTENITCTSGDPNTGTNRIGIGIYGDTRESFNKPTNADRYNSVNWWGVAGKNGDVRIYYGTANSYVTGLTLNADTKINVLMNMSAKTFSWYQGETQKVNSQSFYDNTISMPKYLAVQSWSTPVQASIKNVTIEIVSVAQVAVIGTIASSGYSSLATPYGLDFAHATGLTAAYVVSEITKTAVRLTSVNELPAGSGVILKGTSGATYSIPVKADASYGGTNKLYAAVTAYDCAANEVYILQGGLFHLVTEASTVPAGKAYLKATDVPKEARSLIISDEEDPTAISAIEAAEAEAGALKDGKYLIGNKIVLVKNGVKYSANGQKLN